MKKLKAEKPATGVTILDKFDFTGDGDDKNMALHCRISCSCSNSDHDVDCWIEVTENDGTEVMFYANTAIIDDYSFFARLKAAWQVLRKGSVHESAELLLSRQSALNLATLLKDTLK